MKKAILTTLCLMFALVSWAQKAPDMTKANDSDPEARAILDQVSQKYDSYKNISADFSLILEFPEQPKEIQNGNLIRQGSKYNLQLPDYKMICDGKAVWFVMENRQEVQINDMSEEDGTDDLLSPVTMFSFYKNGQYVYILYNEIMEEGIPVQQIEFKPLSKHSDYSKLRLTVHKKTKEMVRMVAFGKDGSRITIKLDKFASNQTLAANVFTFDKNKFSGYHVEDLRE